MIYWLDKFNIFCQKIKEINYLGGQQHFLKFCYHKKLYAFAFQENLTNLYT